MRRTLLLLAILLAHAASVFAAKRPPNLVFILTDNQGAWTLGCYGNPDIRTPHIDALAEHRRPDGLQADESALYDFLAELQQHHSVSDTTYGRAIEHFGERGVVDLCALCGYYTTLAMVMNAAQTALPDGVTPPLAP